MIVTTVAAFAGNGATGRASGRTGRGIGDLGMSLIFDKNFVSLPESCDTLSGIEVFMARLKARRRSSRARAHVLTDVRRDVERDVRTPPPTLSWGSSSIRLATFAPSPITFSLSPPTA